ncbi:lipopolysaccharide biosynthesis protein [Marisediminicola sp. LYQ85]|uniref:lipopolysaccharide biosynthesis protein n=1 Tax=Marisediminicola sp. LYQ85 TaxID=3391062 RepID=UPI003982F05D
MAAGSLAATAGRGAAFTGIAQLARLLLQLASVVVLSRLLSPTDYGVVAIVLLVVAFGETFRDLGLAAASVQAKTLSRDQRTNLFWVNTGIGAVLTALMAAVSGLIALVVDVAAVGEVALALAATFLLNGLTSQYRASLLRSLRFKALAFIDILSAAVALVVAVAAALAGWSYWALVAQQLSAAIILLVGAVVIARWIPGLPNRRGDIRPFLNLGWNLVGSQLVAYASSNIDSLIVGLRFGTASLGFYNRAFQLVMTPVNQIRGPMTTVALPVLARLQDTRSRYNDYVAVGQLALSYPLCIALGAAAVLADSVTRVALGPQWDESAPILRFLAISAMFQTLAFVGYWVYVSRGLGRDLFRFSLVSAAVRITCILVGSQWGVVGVAVGFMVGPAINWPISIGWLSRVTVIPTRRLYLGAARVLLLVIAAATSTSLAVFVALPGLSPVVTLLVGLTVYLATIALVAMIPPYRADLRTIKQILTLVRGSRKSSATEQDLE